MLRLRLFDDATATVHQQPADRVFAGNLRPPPDDGQQPAARSPRPERGLVNRPDWSFGLVYLRAHAHRSFLRIPPTRGNGATAAPDMAPGTGNRVRVSRYQSRHWRIDYAPSAAALAIIETWLARELDNSVAAVIDPLPLPLAGHRPCLAMRRRMRMKLPGRLVLAEGLQHGLHRLDRFAVLELEQREDLAQSSRPVAVAHPGEDLTALLPVVSQRVAVRGARPITSSQLLSRGV